ncbi:MAG: hypothetical protein ACFE0S_11830 [Rhodospirillales bacterium]
MDSGNFGTAADIKTAFRISDLQGFRNSAGQYYAIVGHNPANRLITDKWLGAVEDEAAFRTVLEFICRHFETGNYSYWLADLRHMSSSLAHSEDWLAEEVFPRVIAAGMTREAVVLPAREDVPPDFDVFGSASAALQKITDGRVRGFQDIDLAKAWLFGERSC